MQRSWLEVTIQEGIIRSWWVFLFALGCYGVYEVGKARQDATLHSLRTRRDHQQRLLLSESEHQADLRLQLNSQHDPAWIELTLMRCLGVVPEDQTKVYFYDLD